MKTYLPTSLIMIGQKRRLSATTLLLTALFSASITAWYRSSTTTPSPCPEGNSACYLNALAERLGIGTKIKGVLDSAAGIRDLPSALEMQMGTYAIQDVDLTHAAWKELMWEYPEEELDIIDLTIRAFCNPKFVIDRPLVLKLLREEVREKRRLIKDAGVPKSVLASNKKFAELLQQLGIDPPKKKSLSTGKDTFAFSKDDLEFQALFDDHPDHASLLEARLATKSTIGETRAHRIYRHGIPTLPIMMNYCGAHTHRWTGGDRMNPQNFPRDGAIRNVLRAPSGYKIIVVDSAQIEARMTAWFCGQDDLLAQFANDEDPYSKMASKVYGYEVNKKDHPTERFIGKTCISKGTLVLSDNGWKPIENITLNDRLWDGQEWVCHQGLLENGMKPTLNLCGIWLTPDHQILCGDQWQEAQSVAAADAILFQALEIGKENLPSQAFWLDNGTASKPLSSLATATTPNTQSTAKISKISNQLVVHFARKKQQLKNAIGNIIQRYKTTNIERDYSIAWQQLLHAVTHPRQNISSITENAVSAFLKLGEKIAPSSLNMPKHSKDGITPNSIWIALTSMVTTNPEISDSYPEVQTRKTDEKSLTLKPVYDILNSGFRNRFTILTDRGPLIVHNCVLGLGYGMGAPKLAKTLRSGKGGMVVNIDDNDSLRAVRIYRTTNYNIPMMWRTLDDILRAMVLGEVVEMLDGNLIFNGDEVITPNGLAMHYPGLSAKRKGDLLYDFSYLGKRGTPVGIWGGGFLENIIQNLSRTVVAGQALKIAERYPVLLLAHDEVVYLAKEAEAEEAYAHGLRALSTAPSWCSDVPLAAEGGFAEYYRKY